MSPTSLALVLLAAAAGSPRPETTDGTPAPPALSPSELLMRSDDLDPGESTAVRFRVGTVDAIPVTGPDGAEYSVTRLHPDSDADVASRKSFHVSLSPESVSALKRLGIADLRRHFTGRTVEVRGSWQITFLNLPAAETIRFYHVEVADLDQFVSVGADEPPPTE